jgi:hypothetical protein
MGLDQFAFAVDNNGEKQELACWRKHPNLQGYMENLWAVKGKPGLDDANMGGLGLSDFNCIPLELNSDDLDDLEDAVRGSGLPSTAGFFFGSDSDDYYKSQDLEFIEKAREALDSGLTVVYDSWW